jgi:hypothetical protein
MYSKHVGEETLCVAPPGLAACNQCTFPTPTGSGWATLCRASGTFGNTELAHYLTANRYART